MEGFYKPLPENVESSTSSTSEVGAFAQKKTHVSVEFTPSNIITDPGLRKPIEEYAVEIRDQVRREYILKGPCRPVGHEFPRKKEGNYSRRFLESWYEKFDWLEYSVEKDAAFCFYCYLFKQSGDKFGNNVFTTTGFSNWKKALACFNEHVGGINSDHNNAMRHCEAFKNQIAYKVRLTDVLQVVRFLILQDYAFRGHDESYTSLIMGTLFEMINWYGDKVEIVRHILNDMVSPQIQKDLMRACAQETRQVIIDELGDRNFFVFVDELHDNLAKEHIAVILRFVNKEGKVIERLLCVERVTETSSTSLKATLDTLFAQHGLSISRLRGQGYNGASNMRGQFNGLKTLILNENPYAFYIHCFAHQLHSVVVFVAKSILEIAEFFYYIDMIVNTVGASCKRKDALFQKHHEQIVEKLEKGEISKGGKNEETSLARFGDTRWGSHHTTLIRLSVMWELVLEVLENVCDDGNVLQEKGMASRLIEKIESFEFVFILHLMIKVLGLTNELSISLQQGKDQIIVPAMRLIVIVKELLQDLRENGWNAFIGEVNSFCDAMSIPVPNMGDSIPVRGCSRRTGQFVTYYHHYHDEIYIAVIDLISAEMNNQFSVTSTELLQCIACLDPRDSFAKFDRDILLHLAEIYSEDFSMCDRLVLRQQLDMYVHYVRRTIDFSCCHDLASLAEKMVATEQHLVFPLVYRLIELALILPVATASIERAFSAMNVIKTDLQNDIGDEWLNDMMVCYIEQKIFEGIEDEKILQHFQSATFS